MLCFRGNLNHMLIVCFLWHAAKIAHVFGNTAARNLLNLTNTCQHLFLLQLTLYNLDLGSTYGSYNVTLFMSSSDYTTSVCRLNRAILELLVLTKDVNANWPLICLKRRRQAFVHLDWINLKNVILTDNNGGDRREDRKWRKKYQANNKGGCQFDEGLQISCSWW